MSLPVTRRLALLAVLLAAPALAQDAPTFDLRSDYKFVAGDKVRVHELQQTRAKYALRDGDKVLQSVDQTEGYEQRYEEEVQEASAEGEATKAVRTYTFVRDISTGETLELTEKPFKVQMARDEEGTYHFTPVEAGAQVPTLLETILDQEAGRKETEAVEESAQRLMMPEAPVAVGATWAIPVEKACEVFKFEPDQVASEGYETQGTLSGAEPKGAETELRVAIRFKLPLKSFNGMPCPDPMLFEATLEIVMPAGATSPNGQVSAKGDVKGKATLPPEEGMPKDAVLDLDMTVSTSKKIERVQ
jgi:hypothetical protein